MLRERVSEDIYVFTSALYAQVTASVIVTSDGVILVDTLPLPIEAREVAAFAERVSPAGARYVILTHYHADHTYGAYLYPHAEVVAHAHCRTLLDKRGRSALKAAQQQQPELNEVSIRLPDVTFENGEMGICLGGKLLRILHLPGHTQDSTAVYLEDGRILFAADTVMPVPSVTDGDIDAFRASLQRLLELQIENLVQGHGEIILRGEIKEIIQRNIDYLDQIEEKVAQAVRQGTAGREALKHDSIESCGLSRIPLNGLVQQIHVANLLTLYDRMAKAL